MSQSNIIKRLISGFILFPIFFYVIIEGGLKFNLILLLALSISIFEWVNFKIEKLLKFFGVFFLFFSFYLIFLFRNLESELTIFNFLLVSIICIASDIGGLLFGKILKGPKLSKISPNKTYSGVLGALILSFIFSYFLFSFYNFSSIYNQYLFKIFLISLISQLGDLTISFFKRISQLKDTGRLIPGHGGLLDRIDGMIFAFPLTYLIFI